MSLVEWNYLEGKRLPWPAPWQELFGREAPILLEIGFGNGQFLLDLAARRPEANVVGLEISQPSLRRAQRKIAARDASNVRLIHAAAEQALWTLFQPHALSAAIINFPDPWPKAGHQSRRLINPGFLQLLASRMHEGAALDIATDVAPYAEEVAALLRQSATFENRLPQPFVTEDDSRIRTKYEQIAREEGRTCHYFKWRRNGVPTGQPFPIPQELEMPHVILRAELRPGPSLDEIAAAFQPLTQRTSWGTIHFISLYRAAAARSLLVDTFLEEPALTQRLGLQIKARHDDALVLALHDIGFPRATSGVHHAIHLLAAELRRRHPQLRIDSSNLVV